VLIERKVGAGVAVLGSLLLAAGGAAPAVAGSGPTAHLSHVSTRFASMAPSTSTMYGGWTFAPKKATSVSVEFKEPALDCTAATSGVEPLAGMLTGPSASPVFASAGLVIQCLNGKASGELTVTVGGATGASPKPVAAGNLIKATVTTSPTSITATAHDLTRGQFVTLTGNVPGTAALQERIADDAVTTSTGAQLPVADFVRVKFTDGEINGLAIGSVEERTQVNMQTSQGVLQIQTGPIQDKDNFFTHWEHS
jgi:hypothetical protein